MIEDREQLKRMEEKMENRNKYLIEQLKIMEESIEHENAYQREDRLIKIENMRGLQRELYQRHKEEIEKIRQKEQSKNKSRQSK